MKNQNLTLIAYFVEEKPAISSKLKLIQLTSREISQKAANCTRYTQKSGLIGGREKEKTKNGR
jgi:hypothetical protein